MLILTPNLRKVPVVVARHVAKVSECLRGCCHTVSCFSRVCISNLNTWAGIRMVVQQNSKGDGLAPDVCFLCFAGHGDLLYDCAKNDTNANKW